MYNDYNENNGYSGDPHNYQPPRRRRGKGFLIVMIAVAAVMIVSFVSVESYKLLMGLPAEKQPEELEWTGEVTETAKDTQKQPPAEKQEADTAAKEGTSDGYELETSSARGTAENTPQKVAEEVTPSVVCIQNYASVTYQTSTGNNGYFFGRGGRPAEYTTEITLAGEGSGIILTEDGYIATNAHVVSGAELLKVVLSDDSIHEASLVGIDVDTDLAVIKIEANGLAPAKLGDSEELSVGQYVMAIGNPGGLEFSSTVTLGIVSAIDRPLQLDDGGYSMNTIQTDAAINPGNSGGALVNMNGQVIGINSAKYVADGYEGLGFAISINEALPIIKDLMDYGSVQGRSMLGVNGMLLDSMTADYYKLVEGFYIYSLENPSAGTLAAGDIITAINGREISADSDIKNAIKDMKPGTAITVDYYRSGNGSTGVTTLTLMEYRDMEN